MAIIGIYDNNHMPVHILACTERHHIVDYELSFIDAEIHILLTCEARDIKILCDRPIESVTEAAKFVRKSSAYRNARFVENLSYSGSNQKNKVFDFQRTIPWKARYNSRYTRSYNVDYVAPEFLKIVTESWRSYTEIVIQLSETRDLLNTVNWQKGVLYRLRIGFFLRRSSSFLIRQFWRKYSIHLLMYHQEARIDLENHGLLNAIRNCHLWVKMSPHKGLAPIMQALLAEPKVPASKIAESLDLSFPHSDLWIIVPRNWRVFRSPGKEEPEFKGNPDYILFDSQAGRQSFFMYHWIPGSSQAYRDRSYLSGREDEAFELFLSPWWLELRLRMQQGFTALALGLSVGSLTKNALAAVGAGLAALTCMGLVEWIRGRFHLPG